MNKIIRKRPEPEQKAPLASEIVELTDQEQEELNNSLAILTPEQYKAACLEAAGFTNRSMIAEKIGVSINTISSWRTNIDYQKAITLNVTIIDRMSRETRVKYDALIMTPVYAELIKRVNDPNELKLCSLKDLLEIVSKISRELRLDTMVAGDSGDDSDLADLQKRRKLIQAKQGMALESIKTNTNIIQFPDRQKQAI